MRIGGKRVSDVVMNCLVVGGWAIFALAFVFLVITLSIAAPLAMLVVLVFIVVVCLVGYAMTPRDVSRTE